MEEQKIDEEFIRNFLKDNLSVEVRTKKVIGYTGDENYTIIKVKLYVGEIEISSSEDYV